MDLGTAVSHIRMEIKVKPKSVIIVLKILFFYPGNINYYLPVSRSRQLYNSESEGRNFFLEKLCELGLGEVSQLHEMIIM